MPTPLVVEAASARDAVGRVADSGNRFLHPSRRLGTDLPRAVDDMRYRRCRNRSMARDVENGSHRQTSPSLGRKPAR